MGFLDGILGGGSQDVTTKTKLPEWYTAQAKDNIKWANNAGSWYASPYMGNQVAGMDPLQQQAISGLGANIGSTNPAYTQAGQTAYGVSQYQPGSFLQGDVGAYMSPYIQNVENAAMNNMGQQFQQNLNTIGDRASNAHALGGSRQGVAEGVAASDMARQMGDFSANLRNQGFSQAQGMMQSDMDRAMAGQQLNLQGAGAQGDLAGAQQSAYLQGLNGALQGGNMNQQYNQQLLDQTAGQYNSMRQYPIDLFNMRQGALNGVQVGNSQTQSGGGGLASGIMGGLGGAMTGASLFGAGGALAGVGGLTSGAGAGIGSILGLLGGLSDENEKTNIEKLGEDPDTGLPVYAYDYKADVKASKKNKTPMPMKRVGPMAQDIEAKYPGSTARIGGKLVVSNLGLGG